MAITYLSNIDLNQNQLQNPVIHVLASAPSSPVEGQMYYNSTQNKLYFYDGSNFVDASGDIQSVQTSTSSQLTITDGNGPNPSLAIVTGAVTNGGTELATGDQIYDFVTGQNYLTGNETITLSGDVSGSGTTSITATIQANAVEGSMLNNNVISSLTDLPSGIAGGDEVMISDNGVIKKTDISVLESYMQSNLSFSDNDVNVANLTARLPQITESVTIGDASDVTVTTSGNLSVTGDLTVNGTTTTVNSTTVTIDDPIFTLGGDTAPSSDDNKDRGIEFKWHDSVSDQVGFFGFDDSEQKFTFIPNATNSSEVFSGSTGDVKLNDIHLDGSIKTVDGAAPTDGTILIGNSANSDMELATITAGEGIDVTSGAGSITIAGEDATDSNKGIVELATNAEALAGTETAKAVTPANLAARSYVQNIGDGSATSYAVTHSLNTRDVIVQLYDNSTYDTVFADVVRTNTTTVTISFASAPSSNDIRVLVTKVD